MWWRWSQHSTPKAQHAAILTSRAATDTQATAFVEASETAIAGMTQTAALWTDTPTPDITASIDAYLTQRADEATATEVAGLTQTATLWTDTPTATFTPSNTPSDTPTATFTPSNTPNIPPDVSEVGELVILWGQWDPANYLQQIGNEYEEVTGIPVNVVQEPWASYFDRVAEEWVANGDSFDMVVGDNQWLGQGVAEGHYLEITDFLTGTGIADTVTPAILQYYAEYPLGSGSYYAYPTQGDAMGWAYRVDLWEDPSNQTAFQDTYGYPLAIPETWEQFRDMAEFFANPDEGM